MEMFEDVPVSVLRSDWDNVRNVILHAGGVDLGDYDAISEERKIGHAQSYKRMRDDINALGKAISEGKTEEFLNDPKNWISMNPVEPRKKAE